MAPKVSIIAPRLGAGLGFLGSLGKDSSTTADKFRTDATSGDMFKTPAQRKQETTVLIAWILGGVAVLGTILYFIFGRKRR